MSADEAETYARDDLLATKLNIPRTRPDYLGRSRLIKRLNDGMIRDLIVVCTPAGFGKTSLLANWAASARWPVAWVSLDSDDNDPVRFWRHVLVALDRSWGGLVKPVLPLLSPPSVVSCRGVVTALINELDEASDDLALVLDDYHVITSRPIHDDMDFLLSHLPRQLHVVIASRTDPPVALARLRARGQLAELRAADLRFTADESSVLLREAWGLDLSAEAVTALASRTEGWVVGLQLAALSLRERPDRDAFLHAFAGTSRYVLDYLSEEVLERQPERMRSFLLKCSILGRLCGPLCNAVTGWSDGQETLEEIERSNLFLIALDEERHWYRFHHLFGDFLRARLLQVEGTGLQDLHRKAGTWCEEHGLREEAIGHAVASGDWTWAVGLVETNLDEALRRGERVTLDRWLSVLPDDAVRSSCALSYAQAEIQFHLGHLDRVEHLLDEAESAFGRGQGRCPLEITTDAGMVAEQPAAIALLRAELAGVRGDADKQVEYARSALDQMAEDEYGPRFWARWLAGGGADWMHGRLAEAERVAAEMLTEGRAAPDAFPLITSCYSLAAVQRARGKLGAALRTYRESLRLATQGGRASPFHQYEAHVGIAQVLYERNHLDDALRHVTEGIEIGRQVIWFFEPGRRLATLAWIRQARGDADGALDAMNEACRMHPSPEVASLWIPAPSERARLLLAQGQVEHAERWTEELGLTAEDDVSLLRERDYLVLARVLLARSNPGLALRLLDRLDDLAESEDRKESLIQIRAMRSLALQSAGDHKGALAALADALSLARPEGYVRVFADEGPQLGDLFKSFIRARESSPYAAFSRAAREHVNRVVRAFPPPAGSPASVATAATRLVVPLTRRELEVLAFVAAGKPNREIADQLVVTLDTVKKHVSNIFFKLGAANRTEAVARAREFGLTE